MYNTNKEVQDLKDEIKAIVKDTRRDIVELESVAFNLKNHSASAVVSHAERLTHLKGYTEALNHIVAKIELREADEVRKAMGSDK